MNVIDGPRHVTHVYGAVDRHQGPVLVFQPSWMAGGGEVVPLKSFIPADGSLKSIRVVQCFGSSYRLTYCRTDRVECLSIEEASNVARPIGISPTGPRVTLLHFYRPLSERNWRQLMLDQDVVLPQLLVEAA